MRVKLKGSLTIKREMFLLSFLFLVLVSLLFAALFVRILYGRAMDGARSSLRECNSQIVTYTEGMFHENATIVDILARDDTIIHAGYGDPAAVINVFEAIHKRNTNITFIYSGYADGSLCINDYDTPIAYDSTSRPWYVAAAASNGVARLVYSDAATNVWLFSQSMRLVDEQGRMVGAVAVDCSNESITRQLSTKYQYASQRSFIVDPQGAVLIHPNENEINASLRERMDAASWNAIVSGHSSYAEYFKDGKKAMAYFERIPQTDFIVVTAIDSQEVIRPIVYSTLLLFALIAGLSVVFGLILSRILIHRFARPVMELGGRIQNLAAGRSDSVWDRSFSNAEINGIAESIEILVKDIANREEQRKAAEYQSFHDSMTGLYNRRFFEEEMRRLDVKRNYPLCLVCCDINGLKLVNDVFGHAVGDRLIIKIAECLDLGCRADDVLARIGGDEFAVILPHTSPEDAELFIRRMKTGFPTEPICGAEVSASLGYAIKIQPEESLENVMHAADEMMYEHKIRGSAEMKRQTVSNIIEAARGEGLVCPLSEQENRLLDLFATALCPDACDTLKDSYRLRRIGLCSLLYTKENSSETLYKRHTESGYRILSALDEYRGVAGYVLHYMERWDGTGWPAGLAGWDIPLLSRIMAVVEAYCLTSGTAVLEDQGGGLYDPKLIKLLPPN